LQIKSSLVTGQGKELRLKPKDYNCSSSNLWWLPASWRFFWCITTDYFKRIFRFYRKYKCSL